jgi:hypothetical protein
MVGVIPIDGLFTKRGVLANTVAVTSNGNLTFAQLTLQLGLSSYTYLQLRTFLAFQPSANSPLTVVSN